MRADTSSETVGKIYGYIKLNGTHSNHVPQDFGHNICHLQNITLTFLDIAGEDL